MQNINPYKLLKDFIGRAEDLAKVTRYDSLPMIYRSNDYIHSLRTLWHTQSTIPFAEKVFGSDFDSTKSQIIALIHDDAEIALGDVEAGFKSKMSEEETRDLTRRELEAINTVSERFPKTIGGYNYKDLLLEYFYASTREAQLAKLSDKFDAFGEALHEVFGGNIEFEKDLIHPVYGLISKPTAYYVDYIKEYFNTFPQMAGLSGQGHPLFRPATLLDFKIVAKSSIRHSPASIRTPSGYEHYDLWKKNILENADLDHIQLLHIVTSAETAA